MEQSAASDKVWLHYEAAIAAAETLEDHGFEAYIIGGAVRDILLGHLPKDFDLVTNATPEQITKIADFSNAITLDPRESGVALNFGVSKVKFIINNEQVELDITTYRRDIEAHLGRKNTKIAFAHLEDDVERRDLTINALALDPFTHFVVDLVGGIDDLDNKIIRFIGNPQARIGEDPLRILRAIRLKNQLGFQYDEPTKSALIEAVRTHKVDAIAVERTRDELTRMLLLPNRDEVLVELDELGVLERLLPEVKNMQPTPQPKELHAEGSVWKHTLLALKSLDQVNPRLVWATLLHDVGKPATFEPAAVTGDRIRFSEHYRVGAEMAKQILSRLRFSRKDIDYITWMIHYHLAIDELPNMRPGRRLQMLNHPAFEDLLHLHRADATATWHLNNHGQIVRSVPEFPELEKLWRQFREHQANPPKTLKAVLGIDGRWLQEQFGIQGAQIGDLLEELEDAWHDGIITDVDAARSFISERLKKP